MFLFFLHRSKSCHLSLLLQIHVAACFDDDTLGSLWAVVNLGSRGVEELSGKDKALFPLELGHTVSGSQAALSCCTLLLSSVSPFSI